MTDSGKLQWTKEVKIPALVALVGRQRIVNKQARKRVHKQRIPVSHDK